MTNDELKQRRETLITELERGRQQLAALDVQIRHIEGAVLLIDELLAEKEAPKE